ncbi:hypothetical protein ACA910_016658 [Epithemia clementina (nom. ined.)]
MSLHRFNHAIAFVFGGYQDYDKFYSPSLLDEDGGLFVAILERLSEKINSGSDADEGDTIFDEANSHNLEDTVRAADSLSTSSDHEEATNDIEEEPARNNGDAQQESTKVGDDEQAMSAVSLPEQQAETTLQEQSNDSDESTKVRDINPAVSLPEQNESYLQEQSKRTIRQDSEATTVQMTGEEVNVVRLASAHIQLKLLKDHRYNIFEAAFFYGPDGDRGEYILNAIQVTVTYLGMIYLFYFLGNEIRRIYRERGDAWLKDDEGHDKEWAGILVINAISLGYFFFILGRDIERVVKFNRCMRKLCPYDWYTSYNVKSHRWWSLLNNHCVNILMGYSLFVLNFFFVQSVNDMVDAILNAIAVLFIIQIDDVIPPYTKSNRTVYFLNLERFPLKPGYVLDWNNYAIHGKLMAIVETYLSHPDSPRSQVTVKKIKGESVVYSETDVCYFFVNKSESLIRVFQGRLPDASYGSRYMHVFQEITYQVEGEGAIDFLDNMARFECVEVEREGLQTLKVLGDQRLRATPLPSGSNARA